MYEKTKRIRKDPKKKALPTKRHEPKVDYDRHDKSWIEEQDLDYELDTEDSSKE